MKNMNCEDVLIQKSALLDGEKAEFSAAAIDAHLETCENCRREVERLENTILLLDRQERRGQTADLWSAVESRIGAKNEKSTALTWQPFVLVGAFLVVYKLFEMIPEHDLGWALKIVPFILGAVLFGLLKENPFKINTELI